MPGITLTISGAPDPQLARRLVPLVTRITCDHLNKNAARVLIIIRYVPREDWYVDGMSLAELGCNSFKLDVTITDETTTLAQKASFAEAAFRDLSALIGDVHPHTNIHVIDCRAGAYSYGGVTQATYLNRQKVAA